MLSYFKANKNVQENNFELDFECVSVEAHNEIFKIEDYKPLYEVNKDLFIHEFGEEVYEGICMICRK